MAWSDTPPGTGGVSEMNMQTQVPEFLQRLSAEANAIEPGGAATRARLILSAAEVVDEGGYGSASVAAIADRAGLATGALYRHFSSKADLFVELFRRAAQHQLDTMSSAAADHESFIDKLDAVLASYAGVALANRRLTWALVYEPVDPLVDAERLACRRHYCGQMARLIQGAIAAGEIPEQDPDLTAAAIVGALAEALVGPVHPLASQDVKEAEIVDGIVRFCRRATGASAS